MSTSQSPQTYYGSVPPPNGPGCAWAVHDHRVVETAYTLAAGLTLQSQITEGDAATVNGSADVGLVIDGAIYSVTTPANPAALAAGLNAIPAFALMATASVPVGTTLRVVFKDNALHIVTSYSPGAPDVTGITNTQAPSNPLYVLPGMGVCVDTTEPSGADKLAVKLPTTAAEAARCIGVVGAPIFVESPGVLTAEGFNPLLGIPPGRPFALHREDNIRVRLGASNVVKDDTPALGFSVGTRGLWYPSSAATGTPQITTGTVSFNGTDNVGWVVDGGAPVFVASNTSNTQTATDLTVAWNANAAASALATASNLLGVAKLTFKDNTVHTVISYSPATADITGITNTQAAAAAAAAIVPDTRYAKSAPASVGSAPAEIDLV